MVTTPAGPISTSSRREISVGGLPGCAISGRSPAQAAITSSGISQLDQLAKQLKSKGRALFLEIEGHTDSVGAENENMVLGKLRASAVRNYLNEKGGIPLHAMNTISLGESRPVADNSSKEGRAENRRVVIKVLE